jgi:hypothetical protein
VIRTKDFIKRHLVTPRIFDRRSLNFELSRIAVGRTSSRNMRRKLRHARHSEVASMIEHELPGIQQRPENIFDGLAPIVGICQSGLHQLKLFR